MRVGLYSLILSVVLWLEEEGEKEKESGERERGSDRITSEPDVRRSPVQLSLSLVSVTLA